MLVRNLFELINYLPYICVAGLGRENQGCRRAPHQLIKHPAILLCHRRQVRDTTVPRYYRGKRPDREAYFQFFGDAGKRLDFSDDGNHWRSEGSVDFPHFDNTSEPLQLSAPDLKLASIIR